MSLEKRYIKLNLSGADVKQLQFDLRLLDLNIPDEEVAANHFGKGTHDAVLNLQKQFGLKADGIVGSLMTKQINMEISVLENQRYILFDISKQKLD